MGKTLKDILIAVITIFSVVFGISLTIQHPLIIAVLLSIFAVSMILIDEYKKD